MDAEVLILGGMVIPFVSYGVAGIWQRWKETHPPDPRRILADRYAKGLIDDEEYGRRLAALTYGPAFPSPPLDVTVPTGLPSKSSRSGRTARTRR